MACGIELTIEEDAADINLTISDPYSSFTSLTDTPSTYSGSAGKVATVNVTEDGLIFTSGSGLIQWGEITGTLSDQTDLQAELDLKAAITYVDTQDLLKADKTNVLELDNTVAFTPDADYEPATKKYVDDATPAAPDLDTVCNVGSTTDTDITASGFITDYSVQEVGNFTGLFFGADTQYGNIKTEITQEVGGRDNGASKMDFGLMTGGAVGTKMTLYPTYLDMLNKKIVNVTDPTSDQDAATKKYVDDNAGSSGSSYIGSYINATASNLITQGIKITFTIPYDATITGWNVTSRVAGTIEFDVWKAAGTIPTVSDSIVGTVAPNLTADDINNSVDVAGWTTDITAGDVMIFYVNANSDLQSAQINLEVTKS